MKGRQPVNGAYQAELTSLRDQLKVSLSGATPEPGNEPLPTVSELAERIKALKAEHTIEVAPERTGIRRLDAEEPVTVRIRRHTAAPTATDPATPPNDPKRHSGGDSPIRQLIPVHSDSEAP